MQRGSEERRTEREGWREEVGREGGGREGRRREGKEGREGEREYEQNEARRIDALERASERGEGGRGDVEGCARPLRAHLLEDTELTEALCHLLPHLVAPLAE